MNGKKLSKLPMRIYDYIEQSFSNLRKKKLRTFLTTFGVVIGIGALVSMIAFGKGIQRSFTDTFYELGLFNYVGVYPRSESSQYSKDPNTQQETGQQAHLLDDEMIREIRTYPKT